MKTSVKNDPLLSELHDEVKAMRNVMGIEEDIRTLERVFKEFTDYPQAFQILFDLYMIKLEGQLYELNKGIKS